MDFDYQKKSSIEIIKKGDVSKENIDYFDVKKKVLYNNEINSLLLPLLSIMPFYTFLGKKEIGVWGISPIIYKKEEVLTIKKLLTFWLTIIGNYNLNDNNEILFSFFEDSYIRGNFETVKKDLTTILTIIDFYLDTSDINDFVIDYSLVDTYR